MRVAAVLALGAAFLVAPPACDAQQLLAPQTLASRDAPIFARSGKVTSVTLSPDTATVEVGDSALLTAIVKNQFGSSVKQAVTWTVRDTAMVKLANIADRSVSAIAKAKVGTTWVDGKVGSLTDSTRITVISTATLTSVVIAPTQWSMASADTKQFTATARWSDGTTRAVSPTWAATGGTITQAGLYTAGATTGAYQVTATASGKTGTAQVTVTAPPPAATLTALILQPDSLTMQVNGSQSFTVRGLWSDGNEHPFTPTWSTTSGTITPTGFYTAGTTTGVYRVIVVAGARADTAKVTLTAVVVTGCVRTVNPTTTAQLQAAIGAALPGDCLTMPSGTYTGEFIITRSGTALAPITLAGPRTAILDGVALATGLTVQLNASYWHLKGFTITRGQKGIYMRGGHYNVLDSLWVHGTGMEAIHLLEASTHNTVQWNTVEVTGLYNSSYGEGIYTGNGSTGADRTDSNAILHNTIRNVASEGIDVKEGTTGQVVQFNTITDVATAKVVGNDAGIGIRGDSAQVLDNVVSGTPRYSVQVYIGSALTILTQGRGNVFRRNTFSRTLGGQPAFYIMSAYLPYTKVYCDNTSVGTALGVTCIP